MFGDLRALVLELNLAAHGVSATVTVDGQDPIETTGIWLTPLTEEFPASTAFQRREPRRVMALSRAEVSLVPRGTLIQAALKSGDASQRWRVEGPERIEADHVRVWVVPDPEVT